MKRGCWSVKELLVWHKWGVLSERKNQICHPCLWKLEDDFDLVRGDFREEIKRELSALFRTGMPLYIGTALESVAASCLVRKELKPLFRNISENPFVKKYLPFSTQVLESFQWAETKWVMVNTGKAIDCRGGVFSMLVGTSDKVYEDRLPQWWQNIAAKSARNAVFTVFDVARKMFGNNLNFAMWPILPDRHNLSIDGASMGLALLVGIISAMKNNPVGHEVVFSGIINGDGSFKKPACLGQKIEIVRKSNFSCLVVSGESLQGFPRHKNCLLVRNVGDIEFLLGWPGNPCSEDIVRGHAILTGCESLSARVHHLDERLILMKPFRPRYGRLVKEILHDTERLTEFVINLERACIGFSNDPDLCHRLLEPFTEDWLDKVFTTLPDVAWRIMMCKYGCYIAEGNVEKADKCFVRAKEYLPEDERILENRAEIWNRHFVHSRHSNFIFNPQLPKEFADLLKKIEGLCEYTGSRISAVLGKMYGSIAQNYGFCGPAWLDETEKHVYKAQKAFGSGKNVNLRKDWLREFNYLVYAYLDAGKFDKAEESLVKYLEIQSIYDIEPTLMAKLNRFQNAAISRFAAETGKLPKNLFYQLPPGFRRVHPWQLWLFNAGRVVEDKQLKVKWWELSVEVCKKLKGPTYLMILLPLSWLYTEGLGKKEYLEVEVLKALGKLRCAKKETINHFGKLKKLKHWKDVLKEVRRNRLSYFPFTFS